MPKRLQVYEAAAITVTFDPNLCTHSGECLRGLPLVFDVRRKRWIRPEVAAAAEVAAQVARCPSGALQYALKSPQVGAYTESVVLELARSAYRHGDAGFELVPGRCALLVIDMQDEFVKPGWTPYWVPAATRQVPAVSRLIRDSRAVGVPVIFTVFSRTHAYLDRPATGNLMPNRYPELGVDQSAWFVEGKVWHELAPLPDDLVVHKPSYGAFHDTPLETILRNLARDTVIICGTLTNYCCGTTARQAYDRGFKVVFGSDVTATDDPDMQEAELMVLRKGFARVLSAAEIARQLQAWTETSR